MLHVTLCLYACEKLNERLDEINLELAVLALARIMCADIHSQNGTAILAQVVSDPNLIVNEWDPVALFPLFRLFRAMLCGFASQKVDAIIAVKTDVEQTDPAGSGFLGGLCACNHCGVD